MVKFGEFIMILELHRQGLKVAAIARQLRIDRKTVRKYISRGLEPPTSGRTMARSWTSLAVPLASTVTSAARARSRQMRALSRLP